MIGPDGEETIGDNEEFISGAVLHPAVVQTGENNARRWVGGAQAALAPHGRGGGWGEIGDRTRRKSVQDLLLREDTPANQLAAALSGLAFGARHCAVSIDDHPARSEFLQERLLAAIAQGRLGRGLLVWRSVLSLLGCLSEQSQLFAASHDLVVGVIGHVAEGFTIQRLRIRRESGQRRQIYAPERSRAAAPINSILGYHGLSELARKQLAGANVSHRGNWAEHAQIPFAVALGYEPQHELLRSDHGDFFLVDPPDQLAVTFDDLPASFSDYLSNCGLVVFESLSQGELRQSIVSAIATRCRAPLIDLPVDIVARGALEAARRNAEGEPVYFDFLPQISTIVWGDNGAYNFDLIDADATLPAGRVYRSPKPARFAIQGGQSSFSVNLRKELVDWPRKAIVDIGQKVSLATPVSLSVEQAPAAGRAQLIIEAPELSRQFFVNWDTAEEIHKSWDEVVAELNVSSASIPSRMVLPCGADPWEDSPSGPGLASILDENVDRRLVDWKTLATKMSNRSQGFFCVSSDGDVPAGISADIVAKLDRLTERALAHLQDRIAGRVVDDNGSLRFLTWQFRRAPKIVQGLLLKAFEAQLPRDHHAFITHPSSWVLVYQGFGRICRDEHHEQEAFRHMFRRPVSNWSYRQETAAAAFLLSRSDTAPLLLDRKDVESLVSRVLLEFQSELGGDYTKFNYAPFLLGGLLRWRLKERDALVVGIDPLAEKLRSAIEKTIEDFGRAKNRSVSFLRAASRYAPLMRQLLDELEGHGGNPNLLMELYNEN
jgi:hypothetical protein